MAAPSSTSWGGITYGNGYGGRIGIYIETSNSATQTTVTAQIWYWSQYTVQDTNNSFYMDWDSQADTNIGSRSINTPSNNGWNTANQVHIATYQKVFNRQSSDTRGYFSARFSGIEYGGGTGNNHYVSFVIPAIATYTVSYNANGGTGAPGNQTKVYGTALTLSDQIPTKEGYNFSGWSVNSSADTIDYQPGSVYNNNSSIVLYAVWNRIIYIVHFNALGGTVTTNTKSVPHGAKIGLLPIAKKTNYKFIGWSLDSNGSEFIDKTYEIYSSLTLFAIYELNANCRIKQNGTYKTGMMYIKQNGTYKTGTVYVKVNGTYKQCGL